MASALKPGWSKPSTILFAAEVSANEKAFSFALAQAVEFGAELILFHAYDTLVVAASETSGIRYYDYAAAARLEVENLAPLAQRVRDAGVKCEMVVRPGLAADQIVAYLREPEGQHEGKQEIDRIVMGTHSPGPIGKLLVGSVAEAVLRTAKVPVCVVGPEVVDGKYRNFETRTILCGVSLHESCRMVVEFAAELAAEQNARLILQHVIRDQDRHQTLAGRTIEQLEAEIVALIPEKLHGHFATQVVVVPGDPTEELLYQGRMQQTDMIVLGAQGASAFAAVARQGVVYKVLAHSHCPVLTLSPVVLATSGANNEKAHPAEVFLAGVF
ncbi:MAG: universal stress protein [Terracidiphilus sp.]|jgi:nucleotide-binding universal stress UspA family protein